MQTGKIVRLNPKGYGFIIVEGQTKDLFFHANEVKNVPFNSLREGDTVTFEVTESPKGPNAINVERV